MTPAPAPATVTRTTVRSGTAELAVFERGEPTGTNATVVLVHGWPDAHDVWDLVADRLTADGFHVVSFDTRGVGASTPATVAQPYELAKLTGDIDAVITATSGGRPAHLVGHDWGGVEGWAYVTTDECVGKVATFTTLSGPNLDHLGHLLRTDRRAALVQGAKSLYTVVLSLPLVRTGMWRIGMDRLFRRWLRLTEGIRPEDGYPGPGLAHDARAAVPLYRTNIFLGRFLGVVRGRHPEPAVARVPVHQLVATKDNYVSASVLAHSARWVDDFTRTEIRAGHWSPRSHPAEVARHIAAYLHDRVAPPGSAARSTPDTASHTTGQEASA